MAFVDYADASINNLLPSTGCYLSPFERCWLRPLVVAFCPAITVGSSSYISVAFLFLCRPLSRWWLPGRRRRYPASIRLCLCPFGLGPVRLPLRCGLIIVSIGFRPFAAMAMSPAPLSSLYGHSPALLLFGRFFSLSFRRVVSSCVLRLVCYSTNGLATAFRVSGLVGLVWPICSRPYVLAEVGHLATLQSSSGCLPLICR